MEYLDALNSSRKKSPKKAVESGGGQAGDGSDFESDSDDSEQRHHFLEETAVESYETLLDKEEGGMNVYLLYKGTMQGLCTMSPAFHFDQTESALVVQQKSPQLFS